MSGMTDPGVSALRGRIAVLEAENERLQRELTVMTAARDDLARQLDREITVSVRCHQALADIRLITPVGRHATPEECEAIDRTARKALEAKP